MLAGHGARAPAAIPSALMVGETRFAVTRAPAAVDPASARPLRYVVTFTTGARTERFHLDATTPPFSAAEPGSPLVAPAQLTSAAIAGPAQAGSTRRAAETIACSAVADVHHGAEPVRLGVDVAAPPHTTSTFTIDFTAFAHDRPFHATDVRPTFRVSGALVSPADGPPTIRGVHRLRPGRRPRVLGPSGEQIVLRTRPATGGLGVPPPHYRPGRAIRFAGSTDPPLRHALIELRVHGPATGVHPPSRVARVRTDGRGRFRWTFAPRRRGAYELLALSPRAHGVTADRACPRTWEVG